MCAFVCVFVPVCLCVCVCVADVFHRALVLTSASLASKSYGRAHLCEGRAPFQSEI